MSSRPRWPVKILGWFCNEKLFDEIVGDLDEMYGIWEKEYGTHKANRLYILHTIKFIRPFIFKRVKRPAMTLNYFKIAWRNISRNTAFALINVIGLSLGLTCAIVIYTIVSHHLSFDNFHGDLGHKYRMVVYVENSSPYHSQWIPQPLGKAFANDFAFAEKVARTRDFSTVIVSLPEDKDNKKFNEEGVVEFTEAAFFEMFNFPMKVGSASELNKPNTALVTHSIAIKYFGVADAVDKVIRVTSRSGTADFRIAGVLEDFPANSHFTRQIFLSYENLKDYGAWYASDESWGSFNSGMQCFVELKPNVTKEQVDAALPQLVDKYYKKDDGSGETYTFLLQPMQEVHFDTKYGATFGEKNIWTLSITGFFMLVIACINFVNLATAQVLSRTKEVGVRKILGSLRIYIFMQFLVETGLIALFSVAVACVAAKLLLPSVSTLLSEKLSLHLVDQWQLPFFLVCVLVFVVIASGVYPALIMTRFQPASVLKQKFSGGGSLSLRRVLITAQFVVSQILIICIIIINSQMTYSLTADLGFTKDAMVMIPIPTRDVTKIKTLNARFAQVPGVQDISLCFESPGAAVSDVGTSVRFGDRTKDEPWDLGLKPADDKYVQTFGLKLIAGRNLLPSDSTTEFLVNETFVKKLGYSSPDDVLGKMLYANGATMNGRIEGVVKDFHTYSFHSETAPVSISMDYKWFRNFAVRLDMAQAQKTLAEFDRMWSETYPDNIFSYQFLDDRIEGIYREDTAMLTLVQVAAVIAILISCLGLYGLVSFMAVRKTKEIGIRKVLGAGVSGIVWLFAREFALLIAIAFIAAAPLAWYAMDGWLQGFVYHIDISPLSFVMAVAITLLIAAITVSYHSMRAALANPARSLRTE